MNPCSAARRTIRTLLVLLTSFCVLGASALAYADGVDVSNWQGKVSWSKVKSGGVTFAFMKASEGTTYTDPMLRANWAGAAQQGIFRGAYHFARPSVGSATAQARYFVNQVGSFANPGDLPPVLDLEATGGLGATALQTWVATWLQTTEQLTGRTPIIYCSPYFWIDHLGNSTAFHHYPLWIAHYTTGSPLVPGSWPTWTFWQRTSSGSVNGISGSVDMNRFNGTSQQLALLANTTGGSTAPPPSGPTLPVAAPTVLSMTASSTSTAFDQTVALDGTLTTTSPVTAVMGQPVSLWARTVGSTTWAKVAGASTDSSGHYDLNALVPRSADYQTRWAGDGEHAASASLVVRLTTPAPARTRIDLRKVVTLVHKGAPLMLYGHLTAAAHGLHAMTVRYYKRRPSGSTWIYVGRSTSLAPTGWHSLTVHPQVTWIWKAVYSGSDGYTPVTSSYLTVRPR